MVAHVYKCAGVRIPSVTTIISRFKDSGGLLYWANTQGLEGKTLDEARKEQATPGSVAHEMVQAHIHGEISDNPREIKRWSQLDPVIYGRAEASFLAYLTWERDSAITIRHTECPLVSTKHHFGGTPDAIGLTRGELVLLDWKCTSATYPDHLYQLAAYKLLWEENYPDHPLAGFHLCRFAKEQGDFSHHFFPSVDEEAQTFLAMRALYDRVKLTEKRVR
jgi:hypothetical protein